MDLQTEPSFITRAPRHLRAILRNERILTKWVQRENFERSRIAFRAIDSNLSDTNGCIRDVGLFSRGCGDDTRPWKRELVVRHLNFTKGTPSPYLSISTSPQKVVNFTRSRMDQKEIVILDMIMLDVMNVKYRSTMNLHHEFEFRDADDGKTYATDTHYLVYEHIPECCILGFISAKAFTKLWEDKLRLNTQEPNPASPSELDWHVDLAGHSALRTTSPLCKTPHFISMPQPSLAQTPNITPMKRSVFSFGSKSQGSDAFTGDHTRIPSVTAVLVESSGNARNCYFSGGNHGPSAKRHRRSIDKPS